MSEDELEGDLILPEWITALRPLGVALGGGASVAYLVNFAEDPVGFLREFFAVILVGWVLEAMALVLGFVSSMFTIVIDSFLDPLYTTMFAVGGVLIEVPVSFYESMQSGFETAIAASGIAAPFVIFLSWGLTTMVFAVVVWLAYGFVETYLPVESFTRPIMAIVNMIVGLIPGSGGNR